MERWVLQKCKKCNNSLCCLTDNYYLCTVEGIKSNINPRYFEYGVPLLLTLVWCIGLALVAFDVISYPDSPSHKVALGIAIALALFFVELSIYCIDFGYTQNDKNITASAFYMVGTMVLAFAILVVVESVFLLKESYWWLSLIAIFCVAVPKYISCELSRNPHHYTSERTTTGTFREKLSLTAPPKNEPQILTSDSLSKK